MHKETYGMHKEDAQNFEACRFDFRLDSKNGLTPSRRKRSDRRNACYNTLFKCKICGSLFDNRAALLEHKLDHNSTRCPICEISTKNRTILRRHLQDIHGLLQNDLDLTGDNGKSRQVEEMPFSPPASIAQHLQSLNPNLVSVPVPPPRKQAKPQKIPQRTVHDQEREDDQLQKNHRQQQPQQQQQQSLPQLEPQQPHPPRPSDNPSVIPIPPLQTQPSTPGQPPQSYICIKLPIYFEHGQPGANTQANVPPSPGEFRTDPRAFVPHGIQPINPTMMMHIPNPGPGMKSQHQIGGMVKPPDWQPDGHVVIKEEPPSPKAEDTKPVFPMDDLEPGEIRPMSQIRPQIKSGGSNVMAVGPSNNRFQSSKPFEPMPMLQPPPLVGMRLPVAAAENGHQNHATGVKRAYRPENDDILDLTKKSDENEKASDKFTDDIDSCPSTPTLRSGASTPRPKKKKSAFVLDNMVAKLWQNKMCTSDGIKDEKKPTTFQEKHEEKNLECESHEEQPEESRPSKKQVSRDDRRKRKPMKGDTSVNSEAAGLQFTFINDSESGKMNLVGVSKPSQKEVTGAQWQQIGYSTNEDSSFCAQKFQTCKICRQLFDHDEELWEHMSKVHGDHKQHKCSKCDFVGATRSEVLHHKYLKHGAGAGTVPLEEVKAIDVKSKSSGKEFMCSACGNGFSTAEDLESHIAKHETHNATKMLTCEYDGCHGKFHNQQDLWKHVEKVHQKKWTRRQYACPRENCGRRFINLYHLKRHLASHKGERHLTCNYPGCLRSFKEAKNLHLHKMQHAIKCDMCGYKCQQIKALNWHMKAKHGIDKADEEFRDVAPTYISSDDANDEEDESPVIPPPGPVFPDMTPSCTPIVLNSAPSPVDLTTKKREDGIIEITPVSPEDDGNEFEEDDDEMFDLPTLKKIKFASPHDMKSDTIEVQQIPSVNPNDPPFYTSVMKVKPSVARKPTPSEHWSMEQAMGIKFHLCKVCKQMFQSSEKMWSHRLVFHDEIEVTKCERCTFSTDSRSELENHTLLNHGKDSTVDHEYVCNLCGKEYTSRHGFKNHMLFRHNEGIMIEYPCPHDGCKSKLIDRNILKAHYREKHGEPSSPQYHCPFESCNCSFTTLSLLHGHQVTVHQGQSPAAMFSCDYPSCDKVFRELKHLKVHKMLHTNEKPMRCGLCDYSCRQRNSMNWHMKSKHNMQKHVTPEGRTTYV